MKGRLVTIYPGEKNLLHGYIRTEENKKEKFTITDFRPYFYVRDDEKGNFKSVYDEKLKRFLVAEPGIVKKKRQEFPIHYEADVPYERRFLIDTKIKNGIYFSTNNLENVKTREVLPCDTDIKLRKWYVDIEVLASEFTQADNAVAPVCAITIFDSFTNQYYCLAYLKEKKEYKNEYAKVLVFDNEEELMTTFIEIYYRTNPDIFIAWNADYDYYYLLNRAKEIGLPLDFDGIDKFDIMVGYMKYNRLAKFPKLKKVALDEELTTKDEAYKGSQVQNMWNEKPQELIDYNVKDVWYMVEIDKKYKGLTEHFRRLKDFVGAEKIEKGFAGTVLIDIDMMRDTKQRGLILRSMNDKKEEPNKGAIVFDQIKRGLEFGVSAFDMSRYYPNIIVSFNLSPDKYGLFPRICKKYIKLRDEIEYELEQMQPGSDEYEIKEKEKEAIKALTETIYGYLGARFNRFHTKSVAGDVTYYAREGIKYMSQLFGKMGYQTLYGDTDGCHVKMPLETAKELEEEINGKIREWFKETYKVPNVSISLKFEKFYKTVLYSGKKKRYCGHIIWKGKECNFLEIKGYDTIRSDNSEYTKKTQKHLLELIVQYRKPKEEIQKIVQKMVEDFRTAPLVDIALVKGMDRPLDMYKHPPAHVRAAILSNLNLGTSYEQGDSVMWLYVKEYNGHSSDVIAFEDPSVFKSLTIDYEKMIDVSLRGKLENILEDVGISWNRILGMPTLEEFL